MLHEDVREARIQHGLSQAKLARLAKIPRSRLRTFEEGGNITINTLEKIVAHADNLYSGDKRLTLDALRAKYEAKALPAAWAKITALHQELQSTLDMDLERLAPVALPDP